MSTIDIDLNQILIDQRITILEAAAITTIPYPSLYSMVKKRRIKLNTLRKLETHFGDCTKYILIHETREKEVA